MAGAGDRHPGTDSGCHHQGTCWGAGTENIDLVRSKRKGHTGVTGQRLYRGQPENKPQAVFFAISAVVYRGSSLKTGLDPAKDNVWQRDYWS